MERIENRFGKTVGIRIESPSEFDDALSEARRLFCGVSQQDDCLVSAAAWPHANCSTDKQPVPTNTKPNRQHQSEPAFT